MSKRINGIAASKGIVIAKAYKLEEINLDVSTINVLSIEDELKLLKKGLKETIIQLDIIKELAIKKIGQEAAEVFEAHKAIVLDPTLEQGAIDKINLGSSSAKAIKDMTDEFVLMFEQMNDDYFKERAADVRDVQKRLLANITGQKIPDLTTVNQEVIIVANDLTPSETSQLNKDYTVGFCTNIGGRTSHAAIMARSMEIPAVVGTKNIMENVVDGDILILDAIDGEIIINPTDEEFEVAKEKIVILNKKIQEQQKYKDLPSISKDGYQVKLVGNIGNPSDVDGVLKKGGEGIGLYRTEFLYMDAKQLPTEDEQFESYKEVLEKMPNQPVVVRTLDIGGDKELSYLKFPKEMNPFLGYRAIRLCLDQTDIFKTQLRALLRASVFGNLKIMFPMIATIEEFRSAKEILLLEKENLIANGYEVSDNIEIGIMVEIPSTAMIADIFAKEVDFFSIGTNDLIQYTMACDRMSEKVSYLYQPYNPAILRMVKNVINAANVEGKWVGMCGEMASDPIAIVILLGLGLHEFSMSSSAILSSRILLSKLDKSSLEKHTKKILNLATASEVQEYVKTNILYNIEY